MSILIRKKGRIVKRILLIIISLIYSVNLFAAEQVINLVVGYKTVNFAGKQIKAIAVNNQIPAPTLHFKEGEHVSINVYNRLDEETAIHWHGILVPWQMDGVLGVNQKGIQPGQSFHYEFTLKQAGTYWYHAHAGLQEQQGLYGAFIIDPKNQPHYNYNKDYVVVLSDWSNTHPDQIFANLKKEGDYYSPRFPLQPSLSKFIHDYRRANLQERKKLIDDYKMMQEMRMSIYDISDVAFDAFLLNGKTKCNPWRAPINVGDVVRLRFIGAGGSTIFHVKIPNTTMQMVHIQGNDVEPYTVNDFKIAPGETYDVLVKINKNKPYVIYAESIDTVGAAIGALVTSPQQFVDYKTVTPFPEPLPVTREMMDNMMMSNMDHGSMGTMPMNMPSHSEMKMRAKNSSALHSMKMNHHDMGEENSKIKTPNSIDKLQTTPTSTNTMEMNMPMNHSMHGTSSDKTSAQDDDVNKQEVKNTFQSNEMPDNNQQTNSLQKKSEKPKSTDQLNTTPSENMPMNHDMAAMDSTMPMDHSKHTMPTKAKVKNLKKMSSMSGMSMRKMKLQIDHTKMSAKMNMNHDMSNMAQNMPMNHAMHSMATEPSIIGDIISSPSQISKSTTTPGTKYQNLIAAVPTNNPNKPIKGDIKMELFGYMDRFIWFVNGLPEYKAKPIVLEPGERYRIIFTNTSMMHHPMHIHGHWFILRKGLGSYDPLLHTIDVAPGATVVADIDTDASGQWFFHCHLLYHMTAGMSRVFQYSSLIEITKDEAKPQNIITNTKYHNRPIVRIDEVMPIDRALVKHPMAHPMGLFLASFLDVSADPFKNFQKVTFKGLYGYDYNKLELLTEDAEINKGTVENADLDIFYWHLISQFWAVKGGVNYFYRPSEKPYWQPGIGIEGVMPYFIDTDVRGYYYGGSAKVDVELSRDTQITNNFFIRLGIRSILASKTVPRAEIGSGLNQMRYTLRPYYRLMPGLNIFAEYEHEKNYGAFKTLQSNAGESATQNSLTLGLGIIF